MAKFKDKEITIKLNVNSKEIDIAKKKLDEMIRVANKLCTYGVLSKKKWYQFWK